MKYCKRCVYPEAAVNLYIDEDGICSSCRTFEAFEALDTEFWAQRQKRFDDDKVVLVVYVVYDVAERNTFRRDDVLHRL